MRAENEREKEIKRLKRLNIIFTALCVLKKLSVFCFEILSFILLLWIVVAPAMGAMWGGGSGPEFDRAVQKAFLFGLATIFFNFATGCFLAFRTKRVRLDKNSVAKNWAVYSFVRGGGLSAVAFIEVLFFIFTFGDILFALSSVATLFSSILFFAEGGLCLWAAKKQKKGDE